LLAAGIGLAGEVPAHGAGKRTPEGASHGQAADQLSIQVNNDRLTLSVAKAPQIYLYGVIDADAPQRVEALIRSGKIPAGSDVYLNSLSGSVSAGMALGRLFRAGSMVTHLGTPRRNLRSGYAIKTAVCVGACTYAYFGGLYRWAPTGSDRIGLPSNQAVGPKAGAVDQAADEVAPYLKDMGIGLAGIAPALTASRDPVVWLTADQMLATGLANNGRLPLTSKSQLLPPAPFLTLDQVDRNGAHRITIQCKPSGVTLTAYDLVGTTRASEIVSHGTRSYFEINRQETLTQQRDGASVVNGAVMMTRPYPLTELVHVLSARSIGAWVGGRNSAFRYGFTFQLYPVKDALRDYFYACWRAAPWPLSKAAEQK
jgi:hypothetical protein